MNRILSSAAASLAAGLAICALILVILLFDPSPDWLGFLSFLLRWVHILGGIIWIGMIWFVNFIQFAALDEADDAGRGLIHKLIVPRVAHTFRHAAHLTLVSGVLLLISTGYLFDRWVFSSAVYIAPMRSVLLWGGVIAGAAMWGFVQFIIWPDLQIVLGSADGAAKAAARQRVRSFARINLVLSIPVTFLMVAATHLF
ncbi:MAG: hypothetical protein ACKVP3_06515 [Hyphomicrobiaceae bacterium]